MSQADTVTRILDSAEELFAEKGFAETSLRMITTRAKVNLAAVNYHFGSKKDLIQAVFARFLSPFCSKLDKELTVMAAANTEPDLRDVLDVLARTMLTGVHSTVGTRKLSVFMRLLGLAYTQAQGHLRRFLKENYHETYSRFILYLRAAHPELSPREIFWRIHFAIGACVFTMSSIEVLRDMSMADTGEDSGVEDVMNQLIPFLAAALER
ncbi:TetR/AcrR family transcriptional regulator [Saccharospirillum impatiens]|uniref:TetR/AcrR family transcriptional regulator n=1 Tax=Saccharospirillum impatiens TaxID=169438 RepID=UPI000403B390|nr:TetR/AcrR family transcriptional regulator [Saccharospirillum impatiens]